MVPRITCGTTTHVWLLQPLTHFRVSSQQIFSVIVSNPPYIEAGDEHLSQGDLRFEPQTALTDFADGLTCIRELAQRAPEFLKEGEWLLLEHGYNQGAAVRQILTANGFAKVSTQQDLAGLDRLTLGMFRHVE